MKSEILLHSRISRHGALHWSHLKTSLRSSTRLIVGKRQEHEVSKRTVSMKLHSCGIWHLFTLKMELTCAGKRSHQDSIRPRWDHSRCQVGSHFLHFTSEQSDPLNLQCLWESWLKNNTRNCSGQIRDKRTREARFRDDVGSISKHV